MKKILIIEDEEALAEMYRKEFLQNDFEVKVARSAEQGLGLLKREKPDLVLLDVLLPKGKSIYFLEKMNESDLSFVPVVAFSNYEIPEVKHQVKDLGVEKYLVKTNHTPKQIVEKTKNILTKQSL